MSGLVAMLCALIVVGGVAAWSAEASLGGRAPYVATGRSGSDQARVVWRLVGRRLTVALASPLAVMFREAASPAWGSGAVIPLVVWCGDDASFDGHARRAEGTWADVVRARLGVARRSRAIRVVFTRDIARRANQCGLAVRPASGYGATAAMRLRRGTPLGCRPRRRESVIFRHGHIRVMRTRQALGEDTGHRDAYRACLAPRQAPRVIASGGIFSGGSGGGARRATLFRAAGTWLAWTTISESNSLGPDPPAISAVDLRAPARHVPLITPGQGEDYYGLGRVTQLAVGADGTLAWVLDQRQGAAPPPSAAAAPAQLYARSPSGRLTRLDIAETADQLGPPTIGPDSQTVTWTHRGEPRSHTITP